MVEKEVRIPFRGRDLLVVFGYAIIDKSCCGGSGCRFAQVPGYVVKWKHAEDASGAAVTEVERITDESERREIHELIDAAEPHCQINIM
ncbi:MAG TPA: hypothetical protein PLQ76_00495 [bacterium]|nr:hypothetical protein [bacterium]